jgi:hypothetical protein
MRDTPPNDQETSMIRKLIAGLALVGVLAVGGASVVSAETSGPSGTAPSAQSDKPVHERRCALGNRLLNFLQKAEDRGANRLEKLKAKQAELAQTDPDKAAKLADVITKTEHRQSELKEYTDKLAANVAEKCPAAPAAS